MNNKSKNFIKIITMMGIFLSISVLLSFLEFPIPIPLWPPYLEMDFSIIIVIITIFLLGIEYAICLSFLKNLLKFAFNPSIGSWIGPLLNFLLAIVFILSICLIFWIFKTNNNSLIPLKLIISLIFSIIMASIFSFIFNYSFILRLYGINVITFGILNIFITFFTFTIFKFGINSILIFIILIALKPIVFHYSYIFENIKNLSLKNINPIFFK